MIYESLAIIADQLNQYIASNDSKTFEGDPPEDLVVLGNISHLENPPTDATDIQEKIVLTLVNVEEEKTLKNGIPYVIRNQESRYRNPSVFLNLYLLFSANCKDYSAGLKRLSQIIKFFQAKNVFTLANSPIAALTDNEDAQNAYIYMDIHTLNFEQINDLWGSLGGKQLPFVMYKARVTELQDDRIKSTAGLITEVHINE